jgi:hypothetical protein
MLIRYKLLALIIATELLSGGCAMLDDIQKNAQQHTATRDDEKMAIPPTTRADQFVAMNKPEEADIHWLLSYYHLASIASVKTLTDEYEIARRAFETTRTPKNQWRLAMLLSIPGTPFFDTERSSTLLKKLTSDGPEQDPLLNDAAFLMYSLLNEQNRIARKSDSVAQQFAEAQAANKKLQDQLDALKAIESTLYQRNKAEDNPKP